MSPVRLLVVCALLAAVRYASADMFFTSPGPLVAPSIAQCALEGDQCVLVGTQMRNLVSPPLLDLPHNAVYVVAQTNNASYPNAFIRMSLSTGVDPSYIRSPVPGAYTSAKFDSLTQTAFFIANKAVYSFRVNASNPAVTVLYQTGNPTAIAVDPIRQWVFIWDQQNTTVVIRNYANVYQSAFNTTQADNDLLKTMEVDYFGQWLYMSHSLRIDRVNYKGGSYQSLVTEEVADDLYYDMMALDLNKFHKYQLYYTLQGSPTDTRKMYRVSVFADGSVSEYPEKLGTDYDLALFALDYSTEEQASVNYWSIVFPWIIAAVALIGGGILLLAVSIIRHKVASPYQPVDQ